MNKILMNIILVFCLISCTNDSFNISSYRVTPIGEFGNGCYISCKMSCSDAFIENIKSIQWDKRHIIVEQQEDGKTNWYMIIATGEELKCCNRDTTIGPVSKAEIDTLIKSEKIENVTTKLFK